MATFEETEERFQKLCLSNVEEVGTEIGRGAYGVVQEMRIGGLKVAGKTLFDHLQSEECTRDKFKEECIRMSEIRHPNTVEFLGVYFKPRSRAPILVMEFLPLSLKTFLENQKRISPDIKYSILYDVSLGLFHLHRLRPPVIHRDLTVNNVLLTFDLRAKIADFGVSRTIAPSQRTSKIHLSTCPGLAHYMPPEALVEGRLYTIDPEHYDKLDIFSFGALILHVWTQEWPAPSNPFRQRRPLTEVQRRERYLKEIEDGSLLQKLAVRCLQNEACDRPTIDKVSDELSKLPRNKFQGFSTFLQCLAQKESEIKTVSNQCRDLKKKLQEKEHQVLRQKEEMHFQKQRLKESWTELETKKKRQEEELHSQQRVLEQSRVKLEAEKSSQKKRLQIQELQLDNHRARLKAYSKRLEYEKQEFNKQAEELHSQQRKLEHSLVELETEKKRQKEEFHSQQRELEHSWVELKAEKKRQKEEFHLQQRKLEHSWVVLEAEKKRQEEKFHSQQQELEHSQVVLEAEMKRRDLWYKADRISRTVLQHKYPDASRFSKTDGNIAAINFGTTFCSLAFATVKNPNLVDTRSVEINMVRLNGYYTRVPTVILLRELDSTSFASCDNLPVSRTCDYEVDSFGYDALTQLCSLKASQWSKYLYFEQFKMTLQQDENVNRNMTITSMDGKKFYLVEVIAFVLKYLKHKLEEHLSNMQQPLKSDKFDWVITVPAIWKAQGKRMMREAAYMAGLTSADLGITSFLEVGKGVPRPPETNPDKLMLALEPEAAAIHCQTLPLRHLAYQSLMNGPLQSDRYVVIDIGGGTVDVTVHRHDQGKGVRVITPPAGNACGGTMVNREFSMFLQEIVEDKPDFARFIDSGSKFEQTAVLNKLLSIEFEEQKVHFGDSASGFDESLTGDNLAIKLPIQFIRFYGVDKIRARIAALNDDRVELEDYVIYIATSKFASFFEPAIQGILACIEDVLTKLKEEVDTVYLVGGFGGCKYTYEKIASMMKTKFPWSQIVAPKNHKLAVVQGAIKYRLKPDVIHSHVMDASYGMNLPTPPIFNPLIHDSCYKIVDDTGTPRVRDVFLRLVEKGEQVSSSDVVVVELLPITNAQTSMCLCLYGSFEKEVKYITTPDGNPNPSIRKIGELNVDMPNPDNLPREKRQVELTMDFSHTEIQIRAQYLVTGEEVKVVADFLSRHVSERETKTVFPSFLRTEYGCKQIRSGEFDVYSWKQHGGLVAKRKLESEAGISTENVHIQTTTAVSYKQQAVLNLPPEDNIAALDYGATYCSLAITTIGDHDRVSPLKLDNYRPRVPNAILLRKLDSSSATVVLCEIRAFGENAQATYTRLRPSEINQHLFFERIKMNLQHDPGVHREMTVRAQDGSQWYLIEVIAFMIRCVKDWLEDHLSRSATPLKATDFNWVITVPAICIWQARGREMMREAAYMAGLCSNNSAITCLTKQGQPIQRPQVANPECLTLAPEPYAVALYCQHMTETGNFAYYCEKTSTDKSQNYVIINIGKETVDIMTAQKVLEDGSIEVVHTPTGNSWGGTAVNRELVKLVQGIVEEEGDPFNLDTAFPSFFQNKQIRASQKAQVVDAFYDGFEGQKEIFSNRATLPLPTDDDQHISFVIPSKFFEHYRVQFDRFANENTDKRIELEDDTLFISYHCAKQLFQPAIDNILECTESVLSKLSDHIDTVFLVGEFGGCNYVYQHIKLLVSKQFSHLRLIVPLDSKLAIAIGAVRFRQLATKFVSQVVDASYGLAVSVPYCRDIHSPSHFKCDEDGYPLCTGVFLTFINEGEIAEASEVAVEDILPLVDNARTVTIPIYCSYRPALKYIWEIVNKHVMYVAHKVGELVINIPESDITHRNQRSIRVMFDFSGPNIKVFARYREQVVGVSLNLGKL